MKASLLPLKDALTGAEDLLIVNGPEGAKTMGRMSLETILWPQENVDGLQEAFTAEAEARTEAVAAEADARALALSEEASAREIAHGVVQARVDQTEIRPDQVRRPGETLSAFSLSVAGGEPTTLPKIDTAFALQSADGMVRRHYGPTITRAAAYTPLEEGRVVEVEIAVRRIADVTDAPVALFALYFDESKVNHASFGDMLTNARTLRRDDGLLTVRKTFSRTAGLGADFVVPAGVHYLAGVVQTSPQEISLDAVTIGSSDVTDMMALAAINRANSAGVDQALRGAAARAAALPNTSTMPICSRSVRNWSPANTAGFTGWGVFDDSGASGEVVGVELQLIVPGNVASWDFLVVSRPATFTSDVALGQLDGDIVHDVAASVSFAPSSIPAVPSHLVSEESSKVRVRYGKTLYRDPARSYAHMLRARDASGALVQVGRVVSDGTGLSPFALGWTYGPSGILTKLTAGDATAGFVYTRQPLAPQPSGLVRVEGQPKVSGLSIDLRGVMIRDLNGLRPIYGGALQTTATNSGSSEHLNFNMLNGSVGDFLEHSNVSNVEVRLAGTNTLLTKDVHYHIDPSGRLFAIGTQPDARVDVRYKWANERFDLVAEVTEFGATILIHGVERAFTAHEDMYRAEPTDPAQRPLFRVRVVGDQIREVLPAWDWIGTFSILHHNDIDPQVKLARNAMAPVIVKFMRGEGIIFAAPGSSLVEMGGGSFTGPQDFEPNRNIPGLDGTDLGGFIGPFYSTAPSEEDFRTAFFAAQTPIVMNGQPRYRIGPIWRVIDAICKTYGYTVIGDAEWNARGSKIPRERELVYLNFGIGATTMAATPGNMGDPARMAKVIDPSSYGFRKPDLIVMDAGMNGTPDPHFSAQLDTVLGTYKAAGIPTLVYGPQMINLESPVSIANRMTLDQWRAIHAQIRKVALARGVGYMPMDMIQGPGFDSYMGISAVSCCRPNGGQHDGPYEQRKRGEFLSLAFLPS